ncbi:hypothetical protein [Demequina sp. NBRC 110053]|uniref:hypothetical protein n=1 Tax=Demequina sp. NBRC 110053 TaxID=1570342 RepID=UPI001186F30A|nr:hypothetical protein [Demequina sp. NBRC 110053]
MRVRSSWAVAAVAALALAACSWRAETPPPDWPSPDAVTQQRDAAAELEQAIIDAAEAVGPEASAQAAVLQGLESARAPERLDAFGGLYVAYPSASPSPSASPGPEADLESAVTEARDAHLAAALDMTDPDLEALSGASGLSLALTSWFAVWVDNAVADAAAPVVEQRLLSSTAVPEPTVLPDEATAIPPETLADLALAHDQARYTYEVLAARSEGTERDQWLARRDLQAARASAIIDASGVEDRREAVYVAPADASGDAPARLTAAVAMEVALADWYAALAAVNAPADKPWLWCAAFDAYAQAAAFGDGWDGARVIPALPGLAGTSATPGG